MFIIDTNFNLDPFNSADAGAERFSDRFFGCDPRCQAVRLVVTIGAFAGGEETVEELFADAEEALNFVPTTKET